ncbi:MAG TPA: Zn-ribbon domain-containing OB-fold protein [Acidimicrobiales bacterium]|jgi:hypothetical protein|nr:Zn-ribbon domain-containing OB-fold protein [Acidimicrobiales bacterium]
MTIDKPRPHPVPATQPYWDALREERIRLQRCDDCGKWVHYPRARCSHCLSPQLSWHEVAGGGTLYSFSVARQPTAAPFADEVPQIIAVVELDEGVRLSTTIVGADPAEVHVGQRVVPVFDHGPDGVTLLRYRLA